MVSIYLSDSLNEGGFLLWRNIKFIQDLFIIDAFFEFVVRRTVWLKRKVISVLSSKKARLRRRNEFIIQIGIIQYLFSSLVFRVEMPRGLLHEFFKIFICRDASQFSGIRDD